MPDDHSAHSTAEDLTSLSRDRATSDARPAPLAPAGGRLPEALFEIAVAAMWSDGELAAEEVERGHALTRELRTRPRRGGSPFGAIAAGALPFGDLEFDTLNDQERRLAYAVSHWVTAMPQPPSPRRTGFMRGLQLRLRLDDREAAMLRDVVSVVAETADTNDADAELALLLGALCPLPIAR
ncbi:MAG: hypothetical protein AAGA54_13495 [Myxococcota bacterium]